MPRPRRLTIAEMLHIARQLLEQSDRVTVAQFHALLGGGTLAEIGAVLRAAKMERGVLPWADEILSAPLRALIHPPTAPSELPAAAVDLNAERILAPVHGLLGATTQSIADAVAALTATAQAQVADAEARATRQSVEAWSAVQEMHEAMHALEQSRSETEAASLERSAADAMLRHQIERELATAQHALSGERRRSLALDEAVVTAQTAAAVLRKEAAEHLAHTEATAVTLTLRAQRAEERAAVAEAHVSFLQTVEPRLSEALERLSDARSTATRAAAELAILQQERAADRDTMLALRAALADAHSQALEAAALAGAQERELALFHRKATGHRDG